MPAIKKLIELPMTRPSLLGAVLAVVVGVATFMYLGDGEAGAADLFKIFQADGETLFNRIEIRDIVERTKFAPFGSLAVVYVKKGTRTILVRDGRGDTAVHTAADEHDGKFRFHAGNLTAFKGKFYSFLKTNTYYREYRAATLK